ncbi:DUF983 domain-containing protein [Zavarzinia compransoris]|uniref:DUF983 domain-containing protein n=1 Tax=Zavarzinia marina TaxID=2911065 RepID=UPI001F18CDB2|nr:DUF983 domain-containing protein [Zavarzinia marina]MCF4166525.1 DUF983 domain-containing protein [Zavarzinia marina]
MAKARCPRCGQGPLFTGLLAVRDKCPACDLDYSEIDTGDGPAVFVILILGAIVTGGALWLELNYEPPIWVHLVIWMPLILGLSIVMLRRIKASLIHQQYRKLGW